jgi:hypothetical protein
MSEGEDFSMFQFKKSLLIITIILILVPLSSQAKEGWSFNVGYQNPPGATIGANFLRLWSHFAIELGIGWVNLNNPSRTSNPQNGTNGSSSLAIAGDANLKYLFMNGDLRPYIQGGFSVASVTSVGDNTGIAAGVGGGFFGGGLFLTGQSVYAYGSINSAGGLNTFFQAGLGFYF